MSSFSESTISTNVKKGILCGICEIQEKKYRCPKCTVFYCSITCFKEHRVPDTTDCKDIYLEKADKDSNSKNSLVASQDKNNSNKSVLISHLDSATLDALRDGIDEEDWVQEEELLSILKNPKIIELLQDSAVKKVLNEILKTRSGVNDQNKTKYQLQSLIKLQDHLVETHPVQILGDVKNCDVPRHPLYELVPAILNSLGR